MARSISSAMHAVLALARNDLRLLARRRGDLFFTFGWPLDRGHLLRDAVRGAGGGPRRPPHRPRRRRRHRGIEGLRLPPGGRPGSQGRAHHAARKARPSSARASRRRRVVLKPGFGAAAGRPFFGRTAAGRGGRGPQPQGRDGVARGPAPPGGGRWACSGRCRIPRPMQKMIRQARSGLLFGPSVGDKEGLAATDRFLVELQRFLEKRPAGRGRRAWRAVAIETPAALRAARRARATRSSSASPRGSCGESWAAPRPSGWGSWPSATAGTLVRLLTTPLTRDRGAAGEGGGVLRRHPRRWRRSCSVVGAAAFGVRPASLGLLVAASLAVAVAFVGLMMLISTLGRTERSASGAGWAILLVMSMLGGGMVPLFVMPPWMATASNVSPVKWAVLALEGALWRGFTAARDAPALRDPRPRGRRGLRGRGPELPDGVLKARTRMAPSARFVARARPGAVTPADNRGRSLPRDIRLRARRGRPAERPHGARPPGPAAAGDHRPRRTRAAPGRQPHLVVPRRRRRARLPSPGSSPWWPTGGTAYDVVFPGPAAPPRSRLREPHLGATRRGSCVSGLRPRPGSALLLEAEAVEVGRRARRSCVTDASCEATVVVDARGPEASPAVAGRGTRSSSGLEVRLEQAGARGAPDADGRDGRAEGRLPVRVRAALRSRSRADRRHLLLGHPRARPRGPPRRASTPTPASEASPWGRWCGRRRASCPSLGGRHGRAVGTAPLRAGYAGGFFHPTTGYSLPVAVRVAERLAACPPEAGGARRARRPGPPARAPGPLLPPSQLAALLRLPAEAQRWQVLERFYRLPEATIRRFYALELTLADRARLLLGRPPGGLSLARRLVESAGGMSRPGAPLRAAVIGSGFGGLAAAIRLQAQGIETVVFEKRDHPGGRAYVYEDQGFTFDAGPTVITAPNCIEELFTVAGRQHGRLRRAPARERPSTAWPGPTATASTTRATARPWRSRSAGATHATSPATAPSWSTPARSS